MSEGPLIDYHPLELQKKIENFIENFGTVRHEIFHIFGDTFCDFLQKKYEKETFLCQPYTPPHPSAMCRYTPW